MDKASLQWAEQVARTESEKCKQAGLKWPENSEQRDRCMARARTAWEIAESIKWEHSPDPKQLLSRAIHETPFTTKEQS